MGTSLVGQADPMDAAGFQQTVDRLSVPAASLWAVIKVETSGCGFQADRRPRILFERHVFSQRTQGRFDATNPDISQPTRGGYEQPSQDQHVRLALAMSLDRVAALESASWGLGQVMGYNASAVGFAGVEEMVQAMCESETAQLTALANFIIGQGLHQALKAQDWAAFAARYNGPSYRDNDYDHKLAQAYQASLDAPPDLDIRAAQLYLSYLGFQPGQIDGVNGTRTQQAWDAFCGQHQMPKSPLGSSSLSFLRDAVKAR